MLSTCKDFSNASQKGLLDLVVVTYSGFESVLVFLDPLSLQCLSLPYIGTLYTNDFLQKLYQCQTRSSSA